MPRWTNPPRARRPCHRQRVRDCAAAPGVDGKGCILLPAGNNNRCRRRTPCSAAPSAACAANGVPGCQWRRWNARAHRFGCYEDGTVPTYPAAADAAPAPRRVVCYSLFWGAARGRGYRDLHHPLAEPPRTPPLQ